MIERKVNYNDNQQRLDRFLLKTFPWLNRSMVYRMIRTNKVKVNGKKELPEYRLYINDIIKLYVEEPSAIKVNDDFMTINANLDIVYEDNNIILINKPIGLVSHEDDSKSINTLKNKIKKYLYDKKEWDPKLENNFEPSLCNRLDRNTSGIIIAAKNIESLREMNNVIKTNQLSKFYKCLVYGKMKKKVETLQAYHIKDPIKNIVSIDNHLKPGYKNIITKYKVLQTNDKYSLLEIELVTGKTHQIRAHLCFEGNPIVGDSKYSNKWVDIDTRLKTQALCSYKLLFNIKDKNSFLYYLNNKEFKINKIWFEKYI